MTDDDPKLPDHVLAAALELAAGVEQRAEVLVENHGHTERIIDESAPLLTVRLTDLGPLGVNTPAAEARDARPDVLSDLRPSEARKLAAALLDLADRLDPPDLS